MNKYCVTKVNGVADWSKIPVVSMDHKYYSTQDDVHGFAQLAYTDDALLVHLRLQVKDIRAEVTSPYAEPCRDSCLEFFYSPDPSDDRYFNIEYNFNGIVYLGLGKCNVGLTRLYPEPNANGLLQPDIRKTEDGWEIFYKIPYTFVKMFFPNAKLEAGQELRGNFYACSDLSDPHYYLSWNYVEGERLSFHRSECFGTLYFENN